MNKQQKIPKIIHYCWFGRGSMPEIVDKCIATWKEKCPDYEIKLWNEDNFNVDLLKFTSEAYKQKKFAFVSDVARLWAVYNYGGIYLDVDVLLRAPLDEWLNYEAVFIGEDTQCIATGLGFAAVKKNKIVKAMLDDYNDREFIMEPCPILNTKVFINLYPEIEFFYESRTISDELMLIGVEHRGKYLKHLYMGSWCEDKKKEIDADDKPSTFFQIARWKFVCFFRQPKVIKYMKEHNNPFTKIYLLFAYDFIEKGFSYYFKKAFKKVFRK